MQGIGLAESVDMIDGTRKTSESYKTRILVVDDNEDSATSLAAMFDMLGHESHVAFDGIAAVEAAESFKPDVVLLDIGLPKMNGITWNSCILANSESKIGLPISFSALSSGTRGGYSSAIR